jgi:hypothetical protein
MKILAITRNVGDPAPYLEAERQRTIELHGAGVVEHLWLKADRSGAVLVLEVADAEEARRLLTTLPVVQSGAAELAAVIELVPAV